MIKEIAIIGIVGAVAAVVADKVWNVFGLNPTNVWFWERAPFAVVSAQPTRTIPQMFRPHPQQTMTMPMGLVIAPTALTSVGLSGYINGIENAKLGMAQAPRIINLVNGKYR